MKEQVTLPEATRTEFDEWLYNQKQYSPFLTLKCLFLHEFEALPFDFQSGVYTAYLRSKGIEVEANWVDRKYEGVVFMPNPNYTGCWYKDTFDTQPEALSTALNEAFSLREQQLLTLTNG